jgi:hypothetical protein
MMRHYPADLRLAERRRFYTVRWLFERRKHERRQCFDWRARCAPARTEHERNPT